MMISTRGRYALRVMVDLAECSDGSFVAMKEVAERQQISLKYLERILPLLVEKNLVEGMRGKGGGYRLTKAPADYSLWEILLAAEGELAPVACLTCGAPPCPREADCRTVPVWRELNALVKDYLSGKTLADLMKK
ncbi:MAG: Rrf2 family transcriptional regulator [Oscillospiraceae bacterium]|nr:Rrf2 family transcriptional regulator [Oscillospiraceae bacterium]